MLVVNREVKSRLNFILEWLSMNWAFPSSRSKNQTLQIELEGGRHRGLTCSALPALEGGGLLLMREGCCAAKTAICRQVLPRE